MSNHWTLECVTCGGLRAGVHWNRGERELAAFVRTGGVARVAALFPLRKVLGEYVVRFEFPDDSRCCIIEWCHAHEGHHVLAMSEYGYASGECGLDIADDRRELCTLPYGHEGDHAHTPRVAPAVEDHHA